MAAQRVCGCWNSRDFPGSVVESFDWLGRCLTHGRPAAAPHSLPWRLLGWTRRRVWGQARSRRPDSRPRGRRQGCVRDCLSPEMLGSGQLGRVRGVTVRGRPAPSGGSGEIRDVASGLPSIPQDFGSGWPYVERSWPHLRHRPGRGAEDDGSDQAPGVDQSVELASTLDAVRIARGDAVSGYIRRARRGRRRTRKIR
jgi:hypothetical protein